ncbi:MAG: hypothetical protein DRO01_08150, partial [Thermoproteota archaeon]
MKSLKLKTILFLTIGLLPQLLAAELTGVGYAKTSVEAKKEALADLSQAIKSEVRSNFESTTKVSGEKSASNSSSNIKVSSNLPILGADFFELRKTLEFEVEASLYPSKVTKLYVSKLRNIKNEIKAANAELSKSKSNALKLSLYEDVYSLLKEYDRYESVATILGAKLPSRLSITKVKVKNEIKKLSLRIDSLQMAAEILAKRFKQKAIFIYPPLMQNNTAISEFGSHFLAELKGRLNSASELTSAKYLLVGEYVNAKDSLVLNYQLLNASTKEQVSSKTITLKKEAYKHLKIKPKGVDFNALLDSGIAYSSDLRVSLNSNRGSENLLFNAKEEIELFVKLNKMGYLYIVGYTQTPSGKMSYLLELGEGMGDSRFIKFINADDASR